MLHSKFGLAALLLAAAGSAGAQQVLEYDQVNLGDGGHGLAGGALAVRQCYLGSDDQKVALLPVFEYRWNNGFFAGIGNGVGYNFSQTKGLNYGVRVAPDFGRKEDSCDGLRGLGDIGRRIAVGGFYNQQFGYGLSVHTSLKAGTAGGSGVLADLGVAWTTPLAERTRLRLDGAVSIANGVYMQKYFGVTAEQSASSGYAQHVANAGARDWRGTVSIGHAFTPSLLFSAGITVRELLGDAADSPITRDKNSVGATAALAYRF